MHPVHHPLEYRRQWHAHVRIQLPVCLVEVSILFIGGVKAVKWGATVRAVPKESGGDKAKYIYRIYSFRVTVIIYKIVGLFQVSVKLRDL